MNVRRQNVTAVASFKAYICHLVTSSFVKMCSKNSNLLYLEQGLKQLNLHEPM